MKDSHLWITRKENERSHHLRVCVDTAAQPVKSSISLCKRPVCSPSVDRLLIAPQPMSLYTAVRTAKRLAQFFSVEEIFVNFDTPPKDEPEMWLKHADSVN